MTAAAAGTSESREQRPQPPSARGSAVASITSSAAEYHSAKMSMLVDEHTAKMDLLSYEKKMKETEHQQHAEEHYLKMQILQELRAKVSASHGDAGTGEQFRDVAAVFNYL